MREYFKIGEFAELFGMDVQTLHYYDRIGVFQPIFRDPETGYREYHINQIYQMAFIRYMRKIGYSLNDVREFQDGRNPEDTIQLLKERSDALKKELDELMKIDHAVMRKVQFVEESIKGMDVDSLTVQEIPERKVARLGTEDEVYFKDYFYFYPTVVFYEGDSKYFCALIEEEHAKDIAPGSLDIIPAGQYLVGFSKGPYNNMRRRIGQIQSAFPEYTFSSSVVSLNIVDQFVEKDSEKYVTAIQMRIMDS